MLLVANRLKPISSWHCICQVLSSQLQVNRSLTFNRKYMALREMLRCTDSQALVWRVTGCPQAAWLRLYSRTRAWHCWDPGRSQCSSLAFVESRYTTIHIHVGMLLLTISAILAKQPTKVSLTYINIAQAHGHIYTPRKRFTTQCRGQNSNLKLGFFGSLKFAASMPQIQHVSTRQGK